MAHTFNASDAFLATLNAAADPSSHISSIVVRTDEEVRLLREALDVPIRGSHLAGGCTRLTVDTGHPDKFLTEGSILSGFPFLMELNLISGWWLWDDFSRLPRDPQPVLNWLRKCRLKFHGGINSATGIGAHWNIFTHPRLRELYVETEPEVAEDWHPVPGIDFDALAGSTALHTLHLDGLDICTASDLLRLPAELQRLSLRFAVFATRTVARDLTRTGGTDELLSAAVGHLFGTLEYLDFRHVLLANFRWGRFTVLRELRVHVDHLFPPMCRPPWGDLSLADLLPASLTILHVWGCRFGVCTPSDDDDQAHEGVVDDLLECALLRLADELRLTATHRNLVSVDVDVADDSPSPVPPSVVERFEDAGVAFEC